jgi:hypothetical protein
MAKRARLPLWFRLVVLGTLAANGLAACTTTVTIDLMRGTSEFARTVRATSDLLVLPYYQLVAFTGGTAIVIVYLWPIVAYFRQGCPEPAPLEVRRRVISAPLVVSLVAFACWLAGLLIFPPLTMLRFGRWSPELMSQHVLSPLVNGFLAATTCYLCWSSSAFSAPTATMRTPTAPRRRCAARSGCASAWSA